jgi:hypothetical protein
MKKKAISISVKEKNEVLQYSVKIKNGSEESGCKSFEYPRPELIKTLKDFGEYIPLLMGIPKQYIRSAGIAGATFGYTKDGEMNGLSLGVLLLMNNGRAFEFKTPEIKLRLDSPDLQESTMWEDRFTKQALALNDEIILYAEGKRAQTELDFNNEQEQEQEQ